MNQGLIRYRWLFSTVLTLAFCLSQYASFSVVRSLSEPSDLCFHSDHFTGSHLNAPVESKGNVCQFLADNFEDDIDEISSADQDEKAFVQASFFTSFFFISGVQSAKSKLHNHPFLESKPFRLLPVFLEIQTFRI